MGIATVAVYSDADAQAQHVQQADEAIYIGESPTCGTRRIWSLIPFTLQMCMLIVVGYVVSVSKPVELLIQKMARIPHSGRGAIVLVATVSLLISLINWAMSTVLTALLVIALAKRKELNMDYRAAAAAAIIGMGATWALGISSSAAQLQANKSSLPESIYNLTGVIPFTETIFLPQSMIMTAVLIIASIAIAFWSAPKGQDIKTIDKNGINAWKTLKIFCNVLHYVSVIGQRNGFQTLIFLPYWV
jgi:short subunit fatty acids transporter